MIGRRIQGEGSKGAAGATRRTDEVLEATLIQPDEVADRLAAVQQKVAAAAGRSGRPASAVRLVVVTKGVPPPVMQAVLDAGATDLGENRAQELLAKAPELATRPTWHFIGRLQRNKVASLAPLVDLWQSVDRLELGQTIARRAPGAAVLAEVNVADDPAKAGVAPDDAPAGLRRAGGAGRAPRPGRGVDGHE